MHALFFILFFLLVLAIMTIAIVKVVEFKTCPHIFGVGAEALVPDPGLAPDPARAGSPPSQNERMDTMEANLSELDKKLDYICTLLLDLLDNKPDKPSPQNKRGKKKAASPSAKALALTGD